jgi:hypothetical protein
LYNGGFDEERRKGRLGRIIDKIKKSPPGEGGYGGVRK